MEEKSFTCFFYRFICFFCMDFMKSLISKSKKVRLFCGQRLVRIYLVTHRGFS